MGVVWDGEIRERRARRADGEGALGDIVQRRGSAELLLL